MALQCLICGGTEFRKVDGKFVCQGCETEYSMEEAKQMAAGAPAAAPAPAPAVDNTQAIENYLSMARSARDAGNNEEAESYANKVLELDTNNVQAYLIKAEAVGWQSTLGSPRLGETVSCYKAALAAAEEDQKDEIKATAKSVLHDLHQALFQLRAKNFSPYPNENDVTGLRNAYRAALNLATTCLTEGESFWIDIKSLAWARSINGNLCEAWKKVKSDYEQSNDGYPNKYDLKRLIERADFIIEGFEIAALMVPVDDKDKTEEENLDAAKALKQIYENEIVLHEYMINTSSWDYNFSSGYKRYFKDTSLTDAAKRTRRATCNDLRKKGNDAVNKIEEARRQKEQERKEAARKAYWEAHKEEADQLNQEKNELMNKVVALKQEISKEKDEILALPENAQVAQFDKQITEKVSAMSKLGLFKAKEKKALAAEIEALRGEKAAVQATLDQKTGEIKAKYDGYRNEQRAVEVRLKEIENEFTKDRD